MSYYYVVEARHATYSVRALSAVDAVNVLRAQGALKSGLVSVKRV